jgi:DNA-binding CsgD family transcriptional regulator
MGQKGGGPHEAPTQSPEEHGSMSMEAPTDITTIATGGGRIRIAHAAAGGLTQSELIALCAAANGFTAVETARALRKGTQTVKTQRGQALLKLGARNTPHAVRLAMNVGILYRTPATASATAWRERLAA